jgi:hypothetical protein
MPTTYTTAKAPRASRSGVAIVADTAQLSRLARDLRIAAPEAWKACRVSLRAMGRLVADDAKERASFSSRIPGSIRVRVTSGGNVKVVAGGAKAPDAAAIENQGRGHVRHPVFGDREVWTDKNSPPAFLAPALDAHREEVMKGIEDAVVAAVERVIGGR